MPCNLFKKHTNGLIKQAVLQMSRLFFGKALQTQQAGGIAFIDRNFEIAYRIKQSQFFAFSYIRIGLADPVYYFIALKRNEKFPAPALLFKSFAGNIHYHILKMINKNDLPLNPV